MKSDYDKLKELLDNWGVKYADDTLYSAGREYKAIEIYGKGEATPCFDFDEKGNFVEVGAYD